MTSHPYRTREARVPPALEPSWWDALRARLAGVRVRVWSIDDEPVLSLEAFQPVEPFEPIGRGSSGVFHIHTEDAEALIAAVAAPPRGETFELVHRFGSYSQRHTFAPYLRPYLVEALRRGLAGEESVCMPDRWPWWLRRPPRFAWSMWFNAAMALGVSLTSPAPEWLRWSNLACVPLALALGVVVWRRRGEGP